MFRQEQVTRTQVELLIILRDHIELSYSMHLHEAVSWLFKNDSKFNITLPERLILLSVINNNQPFWYKVRIFFGIENNFGYVTNRYFKLKSKTPKIKYLNRLIKKHSA